MVRFFITSTIGTAACRVMTCYDQDTEGPFRQLQLAYPHPVGEYPFRFLKAHVGAESLD